VNRDDKGLIFLMIFVPKVRMKLFYHTSFSLRLPKFDTRPVWGSRFQSSYGLGSPRLLKLRKSGSRFGCNRKSRIYHLIRENRHDDWSLS